MNRLLLIFGWVCFAAQIGVTGATAEVRYIGFGDSVTRGSGDPVDPSIVFDTSAAANCAVPDQCGYVWRLEDSLDAAGIDAEVINKGAAGERTPDGLTRINGAIAIGDDVLILMEGTNDVSSLLKVERNSIPMSAVRDNLRGMVNKATAKGLDTLVSSTIPRVCPPQEAFAQDACPATVQEHQSEATTLDLKSKTLTMANDADRESANPWASIGHTQQSVDKNYWVQDPAIGHLDKDGYDLLAPLYHDDIVADVALNAPATTSPVGDVVAASDFVWANHAGVTLYELEVDGPTFGGISTTWHEDADCGGNCTFSLGTLSPGLHSWRLRSRNLRGPGAWSATKNFTVVAPPAAPTQVSPPPDVFDGGGQVTYTWDVIEGVASYQLQVEDEGNIILIDQVFTEAAVCGATTCSAIPASLPSSGNYEWRVRGTNVAGTGPYSAKLEFLLATSAPVAATLIYPRADIYQTDPTYRWSANVEAIDFTLDQNGVQDSLDLSVCTGLVCASAHTDSLTVGTHSWRVRTHNPLGNGPWTTALNFEVLNCSSPVSTTLDGTDTGSGPDFSFCDTITAGDGYTVETGDNVTFHAGNKIVLEDGFGIEDGATFSTRVDY